jgi:hypothetical protein
MFCTFQPHTDGKFYCPECDEAKVWPVRRVPNRRNCFDRAAPRPRLIHETVVRPTLLTVPDGLPAEDQAAAEQAIADATTAPLKDQAWHYLKALTKWVEAGCPTRSMAEAEACRAVCLACPSGKYDAERDTCRVCGCSLAVKWLPLRSKPRMATEDCPKGHWPK